MDIFDLAMTRLIDPSEGGNDDDPHDSGGRTSRGITQRVYDAYRKRHRRPTQDVYDMSDAERTDIFCEDYWNKVHADELPTALAVFAFDSAVQHGVRASIRLLQRAVGAKDDGIFGPHTKAAANGADDFALVCYSSARLHFYADIPGDYYDDGWMNRCANAGKIAAEIARKDREAKA